MTAAAAAASSTQQPEPHEPPGQPEPWRQAEPAELVRQPEQLQRVATYLRQVPAWFLATSVDNRPHVRPFSFAEVEALKEPDSLDGVRHTDRIRPATDNGLTDNGSATGDGLTTGNGLTTGDGSAASNSSAAEADAGAEATILDEGRHRLWFCTARGKDVYQELRVNPWFELSAWHPGQPWLVAWGKAVFAEPSAGLRQRGFEHMVGLGEAHESANDGLLVFFYLEQGWAKICDITGEEQLFRL